MQAQPTRTQQAAGVGSPSFRRVFEDHAPYVWRVLRRLGVRRSDIEDVCQEVFLVVHRKQGTFDGSSSMRTWIYGICIRTASDYRRRAHVRRELPTESLPEVSSARTPFDELERHKSVQQLDAMLDRLDEDKRAVLVLYEIEQLGMKEVAEAVGCPLQTAYSRLHAAREQLVAAWTRDCRRNDS